MLDPAAEQCVAVDVADGEDAHMGPRGQGEKLVDEAIVVALRLHLQTRRH